MYKKTTNVFLLLIVTVVLTGCDMNPIKKPLIISQKPLATQNQIQQTKNINGFKYNPEAVIKDYNPKNHYAISMWDDGETVRTIYEISDKNSIGNPESVSDDNIFELMDKNLIYAEFYDDWTIKETIEPIFNEDGVLTETLKISYDKNGAPLNNIKPKR